jgi:hypothetical protein
MWLMRNCTSCACSGVVILCAGQIVCSVFVVALLHLSVTSDLGKSIWVTSIFIIGVYMATSRDKRKCKIGVTVPSLSHKENRVPLWRNVSEAPFSIALYRDPFRYPVSWVWVTIFCTACPYNQATSSPYTLQPWGCRQHTPPKRRYAPTGLHDMTPRDYNQNSDGPETSELCGS